MTPEKLADLINRAVFDGISDRERHELDARLAADADARRLYDDLARMAALLKGCAEVEPSANLKKRIINLVEARKLEMEKQQDRLGSRDVKGGIVVADVAGKKSIGRRTGWLIGAGVAVVAIVLVVAFTSQSPSDKDVKGTIGGAEKAAKYRAGQIGSADVILENPEFQQMLQNDKVQDLVRSPEFQKMMNDAAVVSLLNDQAFVALLSNEKALNLLGDGAFMALMNNATYRQAMESQAKQIADVMSDATFAELMGSAPKQMAEALNDAAFAAFMSNAKVAAVMKDAPKQFAEIMGSEAATRLMSNAAFRALAASEPAIAAFMSDPQVIALMSDATFVQQASQAKKMSDLASSAALQMVLKNQAYSALASGPRSYQLLKLLSNADFAAVASSAAFRQAAGSQAKQLAEVLGDKATFALMDSQKMQMVLGNRPWKFMGLAAQPRMAAAMVGSAATISKLANDPAFIALMNNATYRAALGSNQVQMAEMLSNATFRQAAGSNTTSLMAFLSNPSIRATMLSEHKVAAMMADQAFIRIMSEPKLRQQFYDAMPKIAQ
jgi:hypothetical protein